MQFSLVPGNQVESFQRVLVKSNNKNKSDIHNWNLFQKYPKLDVFFFPIKLPKEVPNHLQLSSFEQQRV